MEFASHVFLLFRIHFVDGQQNRFAGPDQLPRKFNVGGRQFGATIDYKERATFQLHSLTPHT